jgi:hypothetical protein
VDLVEWGFKRRETINIENVAPRIRCAFFLEVLAISLANPCAHAREVHTMFDRDVKEILIGFAAIVIIAVAIVYLRQ